MRSPGRLPFCLVDRTEQVRPPALVLDGHRSRLVQVCVDSPPSLHQEEVAFWRAATDWRWRDGNHDEFASTLYQRPAPAPRFSSSGSASTTPATAVRAHIDLGADDLEAEANRLVGLGAERLGPGSEWIVLRDPVGMTSA